METLLPTGSSGRAPVPPGKRFLIRYKLERSLKSEPVKEFFPGDDEANR